MAAKYEVPITPLFPSPNANPYPTNQNPNPPMKEVWFIISNIILKDCTKTDSDS